MVSAIGTNAHSNDNQKIIVQSASELDYPPFCIVDSDGSAAGFSVELLRAVVEETGRGIHFRVGPWAELKTALVESRLEVLPLVSFSTERDRVFDFTIPYLVMRGAVFIRDTEDDIQAAKDLQGKEIIVMEGDTAHDYLVKEQLTSKIILVDSYTKAFTLLSQGKYDAVVAQKLMGLQLLRQLEIENVRTADIITKENSRDLRPVATTTTGFEQKFCFAVPEGNKKFLAELNEALAIVIANGTYDTLYKKWFEPVFPPPVVPFIHQIKNTLRILIPVLVILITTLMFYFRREVKRKTGYLRREITERENAEDILQRELQMRTTLLDNVPDCIALILKKGSREIVASNKFARELGAVPGQICFKTCSLRDDNCPWCLAPKLWETNQPQRTEIEYQGKWYKGQWMPLTDELYVHFIFDITERKKTEEALRDERRRLTGILEGTNTGTWEWNVQTGETIFNERWANIIGYTLEDISPVSIETWKKFCHPDDIKPSHELLKRHFRGQDDYYTIEVRMKHKEGNWVWVLDRGKVVTWTDDGKALLMLGTHQDITERKMAEEALEKRMVALTRPLDTPGGIIFEELFNLDDIQCLQDQFAKATGVASIITKTNGIPITKPSNFRRLCKEIIRNTEKGLLNCQKSDTILGRYNPEGPTTQLCFSGGLWDAGAGISVGGKHIANWLIGQVRDASQTDEQMRAYAREIGTDEEVFLEAFHEVPVMSREQFEAVAQALFIITNQLSSKAYQNVQQARFISESKLAAIEKERLERQLQQAQKMEAIGTLAGGIAHDFNNILSVVLGHAELAKEDTLTTSTVAPHLDRVLEAGNRAKKLVRQILTFSRQADTECISFTPANMVKETLKMLRSTTPTTIEIIQDISFNTKPIFSDPTQINQILMNLYTNAYHAMEEKGGQLRVSLKETRLTREDLLHEPDVSPGSFIQISVCDTGPGIPAGIIEKIFDPFFTTKETGKGTGIGLSIVHGIVKNYSGFVSIESVLAKGTTFHVYLPVDEKGANGEEEENVADHVLIGKERILFVDDEELLTEMGKDMLERLGYIVTVRNNSLEALETFQHQPDQFDLIITDQTMPEMSGSDLSKKMLQIRPDIPIILCTGYSTIISKEQAKLMGIKEFALKPLSKKDIARLIREVLDKS